MARRLANVRFYVDADTLGLAHILAGLRSDVTYPGDPGRKIKGRWRPACPITTTDVGDTIWIPKVAKRGWLIVTRDKQIEQRPGERQAIVDNEAKMVAITSDEVLDNWRMLEIVMSQWRRVERMADLPGPFIASVTLSSMRPLLGSIEIPGPPISPTRVNPSTPRPDEGAPPERPPSQQSLDLGRDEE